MARKSIGDTVLQLMDLPGVGLLPAAGRAHFFDICRYLATTGKPDFRLGSRILNLDDILKLTWKRNLEEKPDFNLFFELGLLQKDCDGVVICPGLTKGTTRAETSRENGKKGGRPGKNPISDDLRNDNIVPIRDQQTLAALPISGCKLQKQNVETGKPEHAQVSRTTYLLKESSNKVSVVGEDDYHETGRQALEAMGIDRSRSMTTYKPVMDWLAAGADREMILEVIRLKMRPGITTLKYFDAPIREAIAARPAAKPLWQKEYEKAEANYRLMGGYGCGIPSPRLQDFKDKFAS